MTQSSSIRLSRSLRILACFEDDISLAASIIYPVNVQRICILLSINQSSTTAAVDFILKFLCSQIYPSLAQESTILRFRALGFEQFECWETRPTVARSVFTVVCRSTSKQCFRRDLVPYISIMEMLDEECTKVMSTALLFLGHHCEINIIFRPQALDDNSWGNSRVFRWTIVPHYNHFNSLSSWHWRAKSEKKICDRDGRMICRSTVLCMSECKKVRKLVYYRNNDSMPCGKKYFLFSTIFNDNQALQIRVHNVAGERLSVTAIVEKSYRQRTE